MPPRRRRQEPSDLGGQIDGYSPGGGSPSRSDRDSDDRQPLGVSSDYRALVPRSPESFRGMSPRAVEGWAAQGAGPGAVREVAPRYYDDDIWRPASRGTEGIIEMQRALMIGGYLGPGQRFQWGSWSGATVDAYKRLLEEANASGLSAEQQIEQAAMGMANGGEGGDGSGGGGGYFDPVTGEWVEGAGEQFMAPPLEIKTTNKQDLKRVFQGVTQDQLGVAWSPEQIDELVEAYNWQEIKVQQDAYQQQIGRMRQEFDFEMGTGGEPSTDVITTESMPSPETFAMDQMEAKDPGAIEENTGMELLLGLIDQWGG